jgi:HK97 family phage major capsid protein/HK97 family phage prohead protease
MDTQQLPESLARHLEQGRAERALQVERAAINEEARTATLAFASELPYERWWGVEVLDCTATAMRQGRLRSGANLLCDHNHRDVVGVIESVEIGADRVARAVVRFGKSARAEEVWQDVRDGIRRNVSVGYLIHQAVLVETKEGQETYRVTDWEPYEVSLVSVPADPSVGIGRSLSEPATPAIAAQPQPTKTPEGTRTMDKTLDQETPDTKPDAKPATPEIRVMDKRNHAAEISAIAAQTPGAGDLALRAIQAGQTVEQFQQDLIRHLSNKPIAAMEPKLNTKERAAYSYVRAIAMALSRAEGGATSGLESEISQDIERSMPASYKSRGGVFVPLSLQERSPISEALYNTAGKGSSTVFTEPGDFIDLLRNASVSVGLGARVLSGLTSPVSFPKQTGAASVSWVAENPGTDVTASNATLGSVGLTPKTLQGTTAMSRQLMAQSSIDVEQFIRADLAAGHALAWDRAVLHGAGSSNEPTGIYVAGDVNSVAMGGVPTFGKLIDMVTEVLKDNALMGSLAFATTPGMAGKLAQTVVAASTDTRMIWSGALDNGTLVGYRAVATNQVRANLGGGSEHGIIFGNWSDVMIGTWGALELVVDPYALKKQGMIEVTSFQLCDIALRHGQSFAKATGATIA